MIGMRAWNDHHKFRIPPGATVRQALTQLHKVASICVASDKSLIEQLYLVCISWAYLPGTLY